jgi:hypothetical protein
MIKVTDSLWQGCVDEAGADGFTCIVSVGNGVSRRTDIPVWHLPLVEFSAPRPFGIKVLDGERHRMRLPSSEEIVAAIELVRKLIERGEKVFLHCDAGISRSVGIAAGYLVRSGQVPHLFDGYRIVEGRPVDDPYNYAIYRQGNPFNNVLSQITDDRYWEKFDTYSDLLNYVWPKNTT